MTENAVKVQNGSKGPISSKWLYWHKIVKVNPKEDQKSKTDKKKGPKAPKRSK